ncbi:hypothetical protein EV360DRAFT_65957 [Lentinula raphanica]|nr:hypothetical protein EV360DRAFT_65957 [Lentinula raphanica]
MSMRSRERLGSDIRYLLITFQHLGRLVALSSSGRRFGTSDINANTHTRFYQSPWHPTMGSRGKEYQDSKKPSRFSFRCLEAGTQLLLLPRFSFKQCTCDEPVQRYYRLIGHGWWPSTCSGVAPKADTDIVPRFGPMLIGVFFNMILYGVLLNQMFFYYQTYKSDTLWIKCLVTYLFIVETANTVFDILIMYQPLITEYGTEKAVKYFPTQPIVVVLVSMPIQCFFAWRILKITKSYLIPAIIVLLALTSATGGFITGIKLVILKVFIKKPELHWSALLWFLPSCVADILITVTLVQSLSKRKNGFSATNTMIDKLIRMTVQTGMITNFIWDLALAKLYTNCLMSTLNARSSLLTTSRSSTSGGMYIDVRNSSNHKDASSRIPQSGVRFARNPHLNSGAGSDIYELESPKALEAQVRSSPDQLESEEEHHGFEIPASKGSPVGI